MGSVVEPMLGLSLYRSQELALEEWTAGMLLECMCTLAQFHHVEMKFPKSQ